MLIYRLLGSGAEESFARSWGISYGMSAVTEWDDIVHETLKGAFVMVLMERLFLTRNTSWLEARRMRDAHDSERAHADAVRAPVLSLYAQDHIDYLSLQALLFKRSGLSFVQQARLLFAHSKRVS